MQQDTDFDFEYYKNLDFSNAKPTTNPTILQFRARKKAYDTLMNVLDDDVQELIANQENPKEKARLNAVIRAMFATA